jgi:hypothetical protein
MVKWETVRHQVAIAGRLADAGTGKPVGGALVTINEDERTPAAFKSLLEARAMQYGDAWATMTERPDRARTAPDGLFYFLDLPDGDYTLTASLASMGNRYGTAQATATVSRDENGNLKRAFLDLALQATTVRGKITGPSHKTGVAMAEVRVKGSGERTFSDAQGQYVLAGVEPVKPKNGTSAGGRPPITERTVLVFAQGYRPASKPVALHEAGTMKTLNFELVREAG